MTAPKDADQVLSAIRLGWYVAEVGGRSRHGSPQPEDQPTPSPGTWLPLRSERSDEELRIEAQGVMVALATKLLGDEGEKLATQITAAAGYVQPAAVRSSAVATRIFNFDTYAQNTLTASSDTQACGYLLGRGLAESYWALAVPVEDDQSRQAKLQRARERRAEEPRVSRVRESWAAFVGGAGSANARFGRWIAALGRGAVAPAGAAGALAPVDAAGAGDLPAPPPPPPDSWEFLLGRPRCKELTRLTGRLTEYFMPYTATGVAGTLAVWEMIAADPGWRDGADAALYLQMRRWYEVLVLLQDPSTLVKPYRVLRNFTALAKSLQAFLPQVLLGIGSLAAVAWFIDLVATPGGSGLSASVAGILGTVGISATSVQARLKNAAQSLTTRLKQDVFGDLVAVELTVAPEWSGLLTRLPQAEQRKRDRGIRRALKNRTLTTGTPAPG